MKCACRPRQGSGNLLDRTRNRIPPDRFEAEPENFSENKSPMRHIISVLLENEFGALSRVANLFSARGYNIESLSVAPTDDPTVSRMTVVTSGTDEVVEQITKQLDKLVDVIKLVDLTRDSHFERELMLVKIEAAAGDGDKLQALVVGAKGQIIDNSGSLYTVEVTGESQRLNEFLQQLNRFKVVEVIRSGPLGIGRGERLLRL
jgi:acetolactate synthase-1/3 small subunit